MKENYNLLNILSFLLLANDRNHLMFNALTSIINYGEQACEDVNAHMKTGNADELMKLEFF